MPPAWMWPFDDELNDWFEMVKQRQTNGGGDDSDEEPMLSNSLARHRR